MPGKVSKRTASLALAPSRKLRIIPVFVLYAASALDWLFIWVWSIIIVGSRWGIVTLYLVNMFMGVGTIVSAALCLFFAARWNTLGEFAMFAVVAMAMSMGALTSCFPLAALKAPAHIVQGKRVPSAAM